MINFNGTIISDDTNILTQNRAFLYGDAVFETVKISKGAVLFLEDHYFRLMASMRIVRMEIPMNFTMEYFEQELLSAATANDCLLAGRARITVYRNEGGYYLPQNNNISYLIHTTKLPTELYTEGKKEYEVDLYKDFYVAKQLLSTIKSTNRILNTTASIFAQENGLDNCLILNDTKNVIEAIQGNLFMVVGNKLITPPTSEGCLNGVMRKQILALAKKTSTIEVVETPISPFDLQKADELFITNVIQGIQSITKYRKKTFKTNLAESLLEELNNSIRVS